MLSCMLWVTRFTWCNRALAMAASSCGRKSRAPGRRVKRSGRGPAAVDGKRRAVGRGAEVADQIEHQAGQLVEGDELLGGLGGQDHVAHHLVGGHVPRLGL